MNKKVQNWKKRRKKNKKYQARRKRREKNKKVPIWKKIRKKKRLKRSLFKLILKQAQKSWPMIWLIGIACSKKAYVQKMSKAWKILFLQSYQVNGTCIGQQNTLCKSWPQLVTMQWWWSKMMENSKLKKKQTSWAILGLTIRLLVFLPIALFVQISLTANCQYKFK